MSDTTMFQRPNLQDLVKEAMEGTVRKVDVNLEAARQLANLGGRPIEKQASAQSQMTPTGYINKLANALTYLSKQAEEGTAMIQPGKGPGALDVMAATSSEANVDAGQSGQATAGNLPPKNPPMQSSGVAKDPANAMETNDSMMHGEQPVDPMGNEKTSAVYRRNLKKLGFAKKAANEWVYGAVPGLLGGSPTGVGSVTGAALGGMLSQDAANMAARNATKGIDPETLDAMRERAAKRSAIGQMVGGTGGLVLGVAPGAVTGNQALARAGAFVGGHGGAYLGHRIATKKLREKDEARKDKKTAAEAEKTSSVYARNLARLGLSKLAEDAINPAQISGGAAPAQGAAPPPGASPAQEGTPSEPSDVNSQKRLIDSNEAAINYTKREAKADPKSDVNKVLDEPALTSSTDSTLQDTLEHTQQAGVKISAALTKTAAAQALLYKLAEAACGEKNTKKKEKQSQMGDLSNPSGQSGFSASSMGM